MISAKELKIIKHRLAVNAPLNPIDRDINPNSSKLKLVAKVNVMKPKTKQKLSERKHGWSGCKSYWKNKRNWYGTDVNGYGNNQTKLQRKRKEITTEQKLFTGYVKIKFQKRWREIYSHIQVTEHIYHHGENKSTEIEAFNRVTRRKLTGYTERKVKQHQCEQSQLERKTPNLFVLSAKEYKLQQRGENNIPQINKLPQKILVPEVQIVVKMDLKTCVSGKTYWELWSYKILATN